MAPNMVEVAGKGSIAEAKMVRIPDNCQPAANPIKMATGLTGNGPALDRRIIRFNRLSDFICHKS
jgi:hypothetical protein